jgi:DNA mismatch repair ATPase MutS
METTAAQQLRTLLSRRASPSPSSRFRAVGLFHPFLGGNAVPNDLHLHDKVRVCLVTGPNMAGKSTFYLAEVRRIGALATALSDHGSAVAVIDEPFRGTNVHDAAEATLAVITRLATHRSALVLVASHLAEVVPAIARDPRPRSIVIASRGPEL